MNGLYRLIKIGLQYGLLFITVVSSNTGCTSPSIMQTAPASVGSLQPTISTRTPPHIITSTPVNQGISQATETPPKDIIWEIIGQINKDRALTDLRRLTGEEPICVDNECSTITNRQTGSEELQWVKKYISDELIRYGYSVKFNDWSRSKYSDQNITAKKMGGSLADEAVYFVAHMDGVKKNNGERYPAADDDASGVVDILELARVISKYSFDRTIIFFFSSGEEQGSLGVKSYLDQLSPEDKKSIQYVIDIDMIGYDSDQDHVMQIFHGDHPPSKALATSIGQIINDYHIGLDPEIIKGCG